MAFKTFNNLLQIKANELTEVFSYKNTTKRKLYFNKFDLLPDLPFASSGTVEVKKNGIVVFTNDPENNVLRRYSQFPIPSKLYSLDRDEEMQISIADLDNSPDNTTQIRLGISLELDFTYEPLSSVLIPFTTEQLSHISKTITIFPTQVYHTITEEEKTSELDLEFHKQIIVTVKAKSEYDPTQISNRSFLPPIRFIEDLEKADYYNNTPLTKSGRVDDPDGLTFRHATESLTTHTQRLDQATFQNLRQTAGSSDSSQDPLFDMNEAGTELTAVTKISDNRFDVIRYRLTTPFSFVGWELMSFGHFRTSHIYDGRSIAGFKMSADGRHFWFYENATGWQDYKYYYVGELPNPYDFSTEITVQRVHLSEPENYNKFKICGMQIYTSSYGQRLAFWLNRLSGDETIKTVSLYRFTLPTEWDIASRVYQYSTQLNTVNHFAYITWSRDGLRLYWREENLNTYYQSKPTYRYLFSTYGGALRFDYNRTIEPRRKIGFFIPNQVNNLMLLTQDPETDYFYFEQYEISHLYGYTLFDNLADDYDDIELIPPEVNLNVPFTINATHSSSYIADKAVYDLQGLDENNPQLEYEFSLESPTDFQVNLKKTDLKNITRTNTRETDGQYPPERWGLRAKKYYYGIFRDTMTYTRKGIRIFTENSIQLIITGSDSLDFSDPEIIQTIDDFAETTQTFNFTTRKKYVKFEKKITFNFFVEPVTETFSRTYRTRLSYFSKTYYGGGGSFTAGVLQAKREAAQAFQDYVLTSQDSPYTDLQALYENPAYFPINGVEFPVNDFYTGRKAYNPTDELRALLSSKLQMTDSIFLPNNLKITDIFSPHDTKFVFHKESRLPPLENESIALGLELKDISGNWFDLIENLGTIKPQGETVLSINQFDPATPVVLPQGEKLLRFVLKVKGFIEITITAILT